MTLQVMGRPQPNLQEFLGVCPRCSRAQLRWSPKRNGWFCPYQYPRDSQEKPRRCRYGISLRHIFADEGLEIKLASGWDVTRLVVTQQALSLASQGVIDLPWLRFRSVSAVAETDERERELRGLERMMAQEPRRRRG